LVKARTDSEFSLLCSEYPGRIQQFIDELPETGLKRAKKEFQKAGLDLIYNQASPPEIRITQPARWQQVSSIWQERQQLPVTTNALESINGHRNEATPRRNPFWSSILRLSRAFDRCVDIFCSVVRHNFNYAARRALVQMRAIDANEMMQQKFYYGTNAIDKMCQCGFTEYLSRLYHSEVPCCHLLSEDVPRPRMIHPAILQKDADSDFRLIVEKFERPGQEPCHERKDALMRMTARSIKQLSKTGAKIEAIEKWVNDNFRPSEEMRTFM
jgi:hypothetical protein